MKKMVVLRSYVNVYQRVCAMIIQFRNGYTRFMNMVYEDMNRNHVYVYSLQTME